MTRYCIFKKHSLGKYGKIPFLNFCIIGAVISGRHFPYPVSIARKIMDESDHCALSGEGALEFARSLHGFDEICDPEDLKGDDCPYQRDYVLREEFIPFTKYIYKGEPIQKPDNEGAVAGERVTSQDHPGKDTVSAVAIDGNGYLACANSSGMYAYNSNSEHMIIR